MPQGKPLTVPDDGLTTAQRRHLPLLMVHTGDGKGDGMSVFVPRRGFACWDLKKEKEKYREKNVWSCFFFVAVDEEEGQKKNRVKSRGKSYAGKARSD